MEIISWITIGVLTAMIAKMIVTGNEPGGFFGDLGIGVLGAVGGGWIMTSMGRTGQTGFGLHSLFAAVMGSIVLLSLYHTTARQRTSANLQSAIGRVRAYRAKKRN